MEIPNTINYMIAGYTVIFGGLIIYITSLVWRTRNLHREERLLERTDEDKCPADQKI
jgi:hypothetical protein